MAVSDFLTSLPALQLDLAFVKDKHSANLSVMNALLKHRRVKLQALAWLEWV